MSRPVLWLRQQRALPRLRRSSFGLLWKPGTGKTLPALVAASQMFLPTIYVTTASARRQVGRAAAAVFDGAEIVVVDSIAAMPDRKRQPDVLVVNYELLQRKEIFRVLQKWRNGALILDEAHRLKTPSARQTKIVYGARVDSKNALYRWAQRTWWLTGSPVLKDPRDLWTHDSRLIAPHAGLITRDDWEARFCKTINTEWGPKVTGFRPGAAEEIRERMGPWVDVDDTYDDLPALIEDELQIDRTAASKAPSLDAMDPGLRRKIELALRLDDDEAVANLEELAPSLVEERRLVGTAKAPAVAEYVAELLEGGTDRVLIACIHHAVIDAAYLALARTKYKSLIIDGRTTNRDAAVQAWNAGQVQVLVVQIHAAGEALDLQAGARLVFAEEDWSPMMNWQVVCRLYRAGQTRPVHVTRCRMSRTVDDLVARINRTKGPMVSVLDQLKGND